MHVQLVTTRFDPTRGRMDEEPLRAFCRDKAVLDVREYFYLHGNLPHLTFVITYRLVAPSPVQGQVQGPIKSPTAADLRDRLAPEQRELFDLLRDWRNRTAHEEGIPAYAVLTNRQLLDVATRVPTTRTALLEVRGIGKRKVARYGQAVLAITCPSEPQPVEAAPHAVAEHTP